MSVAGVPTTAARPPMPFAILAGERPDGSPLAQAMGVAAGVLVEVAGATALARVFQAVRCSARLSHGVLCGPAAEIAESSAEIKSLLAPGDICWLAPASGPGASAVAALTQIDHYPVLLTTGDHALLTAAIIDAFLEQAEAADADLVVGLVPYARVHLAFPGSRRTRLRFQDAEYCGSNLFLVRTELGLKAILFWRQVESLRKRPWQIARHLGPATLLRYLFGRLSAVAAFALLSAKSGCRVGFVEVQQARAAVDVDSVADRELAERLLLADRAQR